MKKLFIVMLSLIICKGSVFASDQSIADQIADKLMVKIQDKQTNEQIAFLTAANTILYKHTTKHPAIPLLINVLDNHINLLKNPVELDDSRNVTQVPNVDMEKVRTAVLGFINDARVARGQHKYVWSDRLNSTAQDRSDALLKRNAGLKWAYPAGGTHWRYSQSEGYFNSTVIGNWFADRGVTERFTESISYRGYSCNASDCTQNMINAVKKGFDRFMSEEASKGPHYTSMVASHYNKIGMGLSVEDNFKVWMVFHVSQ